VEQGVNVTLGLPFVRTSPDHGTAFDIAGAASRIVTWQGLQSADLPRYRHHYAQA